MKNSIDKSSIKRRIKYPNKIKRNVNNTLSTSRRGMQLEEIVNEANRYYLDEDIALIYKKPLPITISKISNKNGYNYISKAYFSAKSTTDYNGIYCGKYIDFDTKETNNVKYFPLANIHDHQYVHLQKVRRQAGIAFLIVKFVHYDEYYLMFIEDFENYVENQNSKNVPYEYFKKYGHEINYNYNNIFDYLSIIDKYIKN